MQFLSNETKTFVTHSLFDEFMPLLCICIYVCYFDLICTEMCAFDELYDHADGLGMQSFHYSEAIM